MKRNDIIVLIIVLVIIVGIIIWVATEPDEDLKTQSPTPDKQPNFLKRIADRIDKMQMEITAEWETLRLTNEMQEFLETKINRYIRFIKISLGVITFSILGLFLYNGFELWTAIFTISGIVCLTIPVASFLFFTKVMDVKDFVDWLSAKVKEIIFKKYGFDPAVAEVLKKNIGAKTDALKILKDEVNCEL